MANITFTIPSENLQDITDTMKWLWKIPQIANPAYVDIETTPEEEPMIDEFTDSQWAKEGLRRWIVVQVRRRKKSEASIAANAAVNVSDSIIT